MGEPKKMLSDGELFDAAAADVAEDKSVQDADKWVEFLQKELDLETLKKRFGASDEGADEYEIDYAAEYYNILVDRIAIVFPLSQDNNRMLRDIRRMICFEDFN